MQLTDNAVSSAHNFVSAFLNFEKIKVPYFRSVYKDVQIDISFKNPDFKVYFDDREVNSGVKIDDNHKMFLEKNAKLVKKITLENSENIEKVMVFVGNDVQFPTKFNEINIDNKKSPLDIFSIVILSFFYNYKLYLFSYLFLFLFLYNFKGKINHNVVFCSILILGFLLRISQMNAIPFWDDEVYILRKEKI